MRRIVLSRLAFLLTIVMVAACPCGRNSLIGVRGVLAVPDSLDFGTVLVGNSATRDFTVRNGGSAPVSVTSVATTPGSPFHVSGMAFTLEAGAQRTFSVTFAPTSQGTFDAEVLVTEDSGDRVFVALHGLGAYPPPGADAGADAGLDAGLDAGSDAGEDAGPDAGAADPCADGGSNSYGCLICDGGTPSSTCGNGVCDPWENCRNCALDCGVCCAQGGTCTPTCDGTPGSWSGCRGNGCAVCAELVAGYARYAQNHPACVVNSTCGAQYFTCNGCCPAPTNLDL